MLPQSILPQAKLDVAIIGTGYVGLVAGAALAGCGHSVRCVEQDHERVRQLQTGNVPFHEPGLQSLVVEGLSAGLLAFTTSTEFAIARSEIVILAVGTPLADEERGADMSQIDSAVNALAPFLKSGTILVVKSTVPLGTSEALARRLGLLRPDIFCPVVSNPEFLREGNAVADFQQPDRIVIGTDDGYARMQMAKLYAPLIAIGGTAKTPLVFMSSRSAELLKYASNAFLVMKISFANGIADLCEAVDVDVTELMPAVGLDHRIGPEFLKPGPGFGGSCFPKDMATLLGMADAYGCSLDVVDAAMRSNRLRLQSMVEKIKLACGGNLARKKVGILGLAFKAGTDDVRGSPALAVIEALQAEGAQVRAFDPESVENARKILVDAEFAIDPYDCMEGCAALVILTEWELFRNLDLHRVRRLLKEPVIVDLRNVVDRDAATSAGLDYFSVGRKAARRRALGGPVIPIQEAPVLN